MRAELIAPCGMNCNVCKGVLDKTGRGYKCPGCIPRGKGCIHGKGLCEKLVNGEVRFCFECESFPCARLKRLDKRYRTRYEYSFIDALKSIRDNGMDAHIAREAELWKCPKCDDMVCIHTGMCISCGTKARPVNPGRRNYK